MPEDVHAPMDDVKSPALDPPADCARTGACGDQLAQGDDAVLPLGDSPQFMVEVARAQFRTHIVVNVALDGHGRTMTPGSAPIARGVSRERDGRVTSSDGYEL